MNKISVYILTGFLGAGKTTALNNLLKLFSKKNNIVIENEFGKVAIDTQLVNGNFSDMYELSNGCICCNLDEDLYNILSQIERLDNRPDYVFIETTGVADAGNVAAIFTRKDVQQVYKLEKTICLVDTENIEELLKEVPETLRQIVAADLIVLNKTDYLSSTYIKEMQLKIQSLNPFAQIISTAMGKIPFDALVSENPVFVLENTIDTILEKKDNQHKIVSVCFSTTDEYDMQKLHHTLTVTLLLYYKQVYRIKGIIKIRNSADKILLQSTGKALTTSCIGQWDTLENLPVSQIVIIGKGLKKEFIERICKAAIYSNKILV